MVPVSLEEAGADLLSFAGRKDTRFGTGWSIDDGCGLIGLGEMAMVWARSGVGKSTMMLNIIANTPDVPTVVFDMEMTPRKLQEWLTAMTCELTVGGRDVENVLRAGPDDARYHEVEHAVRTMHQQFRQVHFLNPSYPQVQDLMLAVDDIEDMTGVRPRRVFIDHLTLMDNAQDYSGVIRTSAQLHSWAMREGMAIYALQQTGRSGGADGTRSDGHRAVTLSSGVFGGEADADWVYGVYRPDKAPKFFEDRRFMSASRRMELDVEYEEVRGIVVLQVIKNRPFGDTNEAGIQLRYDAHTRRYRELGGER